MYLEKNLFFLKIQVFTQEKVLKELFKKVFLSGGKWLFEALTFFEKKTNILRERK